MRQPITRCEEPELRHDGRWFESIFNSRIALVRGNYQALTLRLALWKFAPKFWRPDRFCYDECYEKCYINCYSEPNRFGGKPQKH